MHGEDTILDLIDRGQVVDVRGTNLGRVGQIFQSNSTGAPTFVSVDDGTGSQTLIPLHGSQVRGEEIHIAYDADTVAGAPRTRAGVPLSEQDEGDVGRYYAGRAASAEPSAARPSPDAGASGEPAAAAGLGAAADGREVASVVRSEERLAISTEWVPVRRARLEKFQVTEMQTVTVPVTREDVRVVYEPIEPGAVAAPNAPQGATSPRPLVLLHEQIVVSKQWVAAELVHLAVDTVREAREVTGEVRKEQVSVEDSTTPDARAT